MSTQAHDAKYYADRAERLIAIAAMGRDPETIVQAVRAARMLAENAYVGGQIAGMCEANAEVRRAFNTYSPIFVKQDGKPDEPLPAKRRWWRRLFGTAQREDMRE